MHVSFNVLWREHLSALGWDAASNLRRQRAGSLYGGACTPRRWQLTSHVKKENDDIAGAVPKGSQPVGPTQTTWDIYASLRRPAPDTPA
jgi:hypothetical protein